MTLDRDFSERPPAEHPHRTTSYGIPSEFRGASLLPEHTPPLSTRAVNPHRATLHGILSKFFGPSFPPECTPQHGIPVRLTCQQRASDSCMGLLHDLTKAHLAGTAGVTAPHPARIGRLTIA